LAKLESDPYYVPSAEAKNLREDWLNADLHKVTVVPAFFPAEKRDDIRPVKLWAAVYVRPPNATNYTRVAGATAASTMWSGTLQASNAFQLEYHAWAEQAEYRYIVFAYAPQSLKRDLKDSAFEKLSKDLPAVKWESAQGSWNGKTLYLVIQQRLRATFRGVFGQDPWFDSFVKNTGRFCETALQFLNESYPQLTLLCLGIPSPSHFVVTACKSLRPFDWQMAVQRQWIHVRN
jgi:hypothetical protein